MKLPQRVLQHISESVSFRLFSSKIPENWIVRETTERDYGVDCYLELVNENNELTGELVLIQLKSKLSIPWTKNDYYSLTGIEISTSNYWYRLPVPVFIFLADLDNQELYFVSVGHYIKTNYDEYNRQTVFNYKIQKANIFEGENGISAFKSYFYYEYYRQQFENELLFFLSSVKHFQEFQNEHDNGDFHLGIETTDLIYFEAMHRNYRFLCNYLSINNPIPDLNELRKRSRERFTGEYLYHYELYEQDLAEWIVVFKHLTVEIIQKVKSFLEKELNYWSEVNPTLVDYVDNIGDDGRLQEL